LLSTALYLVGIAGGDSQQPTYRDIPPDRKEFRNIIPEGYYPIKMAPGQGTATVSPSSGIRAGEMWTLKITYTVGEEASSRMMGCYS